MVEEHFKNNNLDYRDYEFCLACTDPDSPDLKWLVEKIEKLIGSKITLSYLQIGITIGAYTGPGTVGCCFIQKYNA